MSFRWTSSPRKQRSRWESNPDCHDTRVVCRRNTSRPCRCGDRRRTTREAVFRKSIIRAAPAGFEPAPLPLTAGRTTVVLRSNSSQDGRIRTDVLQHPKLADYQALLHPDPRTESVQGDSNSRIHHGKVAGCQATSWTQTEAPGVGIEPTPAGSEPAVLPLDDPGLHSSPIAVPVVPRSDKQAASRHGPRLLERTCD